MRARHAQWDGEFKVIKGGVGALFPFLGAQKEGERKISRSFTYYFIHSATPSLVKSTTGASLTWRVSSQREMDKQLACFHCKLNIGPAQV